MAVLSAYMCNLMNVWFLQRPEASAGSPGMANTASCEPPSGCWELNRVLRKNIKFPLTAEPSLDPFQNSGTWITIMLGIFVAVSHAMDVLNYMVLSTKAD